VLKQTLFGKTYTFNDVKSVLSCASEEKTGDVMAGIAAESDKERSAARFVLADMTLSCLYENPAAPYESDEVTRVIIDTVDPIAYASIKSWTVGQLREFILREDGERIRAVAAGLTAEMISAVTKLMSNMDLVYAARKLPVTATCNTTIGMPGTFSVRVQPNHPTDDIEGILASTCEGLSYACGDAVIGVNPSTDNARGVMEILAALAGLCNKYNIPTQSCVLSHVTTQMTALGLGAAMDLMFQSIGGSQIANEEFGISAAMLDEAYDMMKHMKSSAGDNFMYFETGQGSALSAEGHHGADQLTLEARAYGLAKRYKPFLVNTVVGFIGPEYLYDGRQIARAALEDHFMGKLTGLPMGVDVCYTNHARADINDTDSIALQLGAAGCNYIMGVPATDDIMLMYQSTSFHDSAALREILEKRPIKVFEKRMEELGILENGRLTDRAGDTSLFGLPKAAAQRYTSARINVGHTGARMKTHTYIKLRADHAIAMDAVWDDGNCEEADKLGFIRVQTLVTSKEEYIRRPDRARRFSAETIDYIKKTAIMKPQIQILAADGLSPRAIDANIAEIYRLVTDMCHEQGYTLGTPFFIKYGRVAAMDKISEAIGAQITLLFVGERPGLATDESMSCYMAYEASSAKPESQRNVVSNIHRGGLSNKTAAMHIMTLIKHMLIHETSGVELNMLTGGGEGSAARLAGGDCLYGGDNY